jgi:hypothetical protein
MYFKAFLRLACLLFLICSSLSASAQQFSGNKRAPANSVTYGFVSPNTREGLKLEDAIRHLNSPEEESLIRQAPSLACVAGSTIGTFKALGSWSDGAEHSVLLRARTDEQTLRYVVSVLGRNTEQKAVLYFRQQRDGPAVIYSLWPQKRVGSLRNVAKLLDRSGIEFRTLVPWKRSVMVYVVDTKRELHAKVMAAARALRARVVSERGTAGFIGDDSSREKAKVVFDQEIQTFEAKNSELVNTCQNRTRSR